MSASAIVSTNVYRPADHFDETSHRVSFNVDKPAGERRRSLDITRAEREIGYVPAVALHEGLQRTIAWYRSAHGGTTTP
jgi:nucleoside-diphosphate-sugar epimerase